MTPCRYVDTSKPDDIATIYTSVARVVSVHLHLSGSSNVDVNPGRRQSVIVMARGQFGLQSNAVRAVASTSDDGGTKMRRRQFRASICSLRS
jgi:hypothetical protein